MRSFLLWTAAAFSIPSLVHGFHNVTYNSNDPSLAYSPVGAWRDWPAAGCLSWPIGQWSSVPGSITLRFSGVAIYAYGLFDDASIPILTAQIDDEPAVKLSSDAPADATRCDPIFARTGLTYGNHTIVLKLTNQRPDDVKDLSFQGFMVTVPDVGDNVSGPNTPRKSHTGIIIAAVAVVAVVIILLLVAVFFWRRRKNRSNKPAPVSTNGFTDPMISQKVDSPDHSIPPPVPFFLPPNQQPIQQNPGQPPWASGTPDNSSPYGNTPYNQQQQQQQQQQQGYFPGGPAYGLGATGGYVPSVTPPIHPTSPSYYGTPSGYSDPNAPHPHQAAHLSYQPPPSDYSGTMYTATTMSGYGAPSEKAQIAADYATPSNQYTPPMVPPPAEPTMSTTNVPYRKGQVNPHAAPVTRPEGQGTSGDMAPPPEYGS